METLVVRKAILNTVAAAGANVKDVAASGAYPGATIICTDNTLNPLINLLPPIRKGSCVSGVKQASNAEIRQVAYIGRLAETIVASRRYKLQIGQPADTYEGQVKDTDKYAYTAPAVLSGNAATDRHNVYTVLAAKINAQSSNNVTAYVVYSIAFTTGSTAKPLVGETVTQQTSGVTAKIAAVDVTSGNFGANNAAGTVYLYNFSDVTSWSALSKTITGATSTAVMTTNAVLTTGAGLAIFDDAGYYAARPNSKRGPSYVGLMEGFTTATVEVGVDTLAVGTTGLISGLFGVHSFGIGTRMLQDVPSFTPDKTVITEGEAGMILNAAPVAGQTYTAFILTVNENPSDTNINGATKGLPFIYTLYADESDGTNLTNLGTALNNSLGITIA